MAGNVSSVYVAGPSTWFVNVGESKAWLYLGMCEGDTYLDLTPEWEGISFDGGGSRLDLDMQFLGATAGVSGDLAYWQEPTLNLVKNWLNDSTATPGQWANGTIGTMVRQEGKAMSLIINSQYATKDAYAEQGAIPCWYFPWVVPGGMRRGLSTRASRERVSFDCKPVLNGLGGGVLYYTSLNGISLPPVA